MMSTLMAVCDDRKPRAIDKLIVLLCLKAPVVALERYGLGRKAFALPIRLNLLIQLFVHSPRLSPGQEAVVPAPPFKICAPISCLATRWLHKSNVVLKKCGPLVIFVSPCCEYRLRTCPSLVNQWCRLRSLKFLTPTPLLFG